MQRLHQELVKLQKQIADERAAFNKDMEHNRLQAKKDLAQTLENERKLHWEQIEAKRKRECDEIKEKRTEALNAISTENEALCKKRENFEQQKQEEEKNRISKEKDLRKRENAVATGEEMLKEDRDAFKEKVELRAGKELQKLQQKLDIQTKLCEDLTSERNDLEQQIFDRKELDRKFGHDSEALLKEVKKSRATIANLEKELARRPDMKAAEQLATLQTERDKLQGELERLTYNYTTLRAQQNINLIAVTELETLRDANAALEVRCDQNMNQVSLLEEEVNKYKKLNELPKEKEARIGVIEDPIFTDIKRTNFATSEENDWLDDILNKIEESGFFFPKRLLYAFHTSLKIAEWAPLTILMGVSGTGKSELPRLYARFGGFQYCPVAVQPNWDSPQDLFGFFNYMDNRFNATPLLRSMVQSQRAKDNGGFEDGMLLVLLDEMNLAKVEQYFSDLLSLLELRRGETKPTQLKIDIGSGLEKISRKSWQKYTICRYCK